MRRALFAAIEGNHPTHCFKHSTEDMIRLVPRACSTWRCDHPGIFVHPRIIRYYCEYHKEDDMVLLQNIKCAFSSCERIPRSSFKNKNERQFCARHRHDAKKTTAGSPRRKKTKPVRSRRGTFCIAEGCIRLNLYGEEGRIPEYCLDHIKPGMVKPRCIFESCTTLPRYGFECEKNIATYCNVHKLPGMTKLMYNDGRLFKKRKKTMATMTLITDDSDETDDDHEMEEICEGYSSSTYSDDDDVGKNKNQNKRRLLVAL